MNEPDVVLNKSYRSFTSFSSYQNASLVLILITYGTGKLFLNGTASNLKRGSLCFLTPFDSFLFEADSDSKMQAWVIEFSSSFMLDFLADPFIDLFTFQVLREKNEIAQLNNDIALEASTMIESLLPEPCDGTIAEYLHNRNVLHFLFSLANRSIANIAPQIGSDNQ